MPICPVCNAEYREEFKRCANCEVDLVEGLAEGEDDKFERLEKAVAEQKATLSEPRPLEDAQRDAELLREAKIHCLIWANEQLIGPTGVPLYYHLALLPEDVELAKQTLQARRAKMLAVEGLHSDAAVVDLSAATLTCPACGFVFPRADECPDCGLFVGAEAPVQAAFRQENEATPAEATPDATAAPERKET
jgi:rubrerythrin